MRSSSGVASARSMLVLGHGRWWKTHLCAKPGVSATASLPNVGDRGSLQLRNFCRRLPRLPQRTSRGRMWVSQAIRAMMPQSHSGT